MPRIQLSFTDAAPILSLFPIGGIGRFEVIARTGFYGLEIGLRALPAVRVLRVVHPPRQTIEEHRHDRSFIGLYALGGYRECYDGGEVDISAPSVVLHPAGQPHADRVGDGGLEMISIEFDPAWLSAHGVSIRLARSQIWQGGVVALAARRLARAWTDASVSERNLALLTGRFLHLSQTSDAVLRPRWLDRIEEAMKEPNAPSTIEMARRLDFHPAWLARAYRMATGEGLHETVRRKRLERASQMLRETDGPLAEVALAAGFCDQSHMNRSFRAVVGRTPVQVRSERNFPHP